VDECQPLTPGSGVVGDRGRVGRVKQTMLTMGSSILKGGGTTLIGTLPLVGSYKSCLPRHVTLRTSDPRLVGSFHIMWRALFIRPKPTACC